MSQDWILLALRMLAVVVLYAFLFVAVWVVWRDLKSASSERQQEIPSDLVNSEPIPSGWLLVMSPADTSLQVGDLVALLPRATLGRSASNHIVLSDPSVSSYHARIDWRSGDWWLTDLGSKNGTRLNGAPMSVAMPLVDGDVVGLGLVSFEFKIETESTRDPG